ncbi:MAG: 50S ribosome-binding protein YggL [Gemmatimonadaceae bacterium]
MTAPCPTFGFQVVLEPLPDLSHADRHGLWVAWTDVLEAQGLYCERRPGADRMECVVLRDGAQATDSDRTSTRDWLAERADLAGWTMGDLEDLKAVDPLHRTTE